MIFPYVQCSLRLPDSNQIPVPRFVYYDADQGVIFDILGFSEFSENKWVDRTAPGFPAVHAGALLAVSFILGLDTSDLRIKIRHNETYYFDFIGKHKAR